MRRALLLGAVVVLATDASAQSPVATIPRFRGQVTDTTWINDVGGMGYSPVDEALAWPHPDTLLVAHLEQYAAADVYGSTCEGSGYYRIVIPRGEARVISTGKPACGAVATFGGLMMKTTIDPAGIIAIGVNHAWVNRLVLVRARLPSGALESIASECAVYAAEPDLSRDGRSIVFVGMCESREQPHYDLYVANADGTTLRKVAAIPGASARQPRWSADGSRIAYTLTRDDENDREETIAVIDTTGGAPRSIAKGDSPAWSPDGSWLAYFVRRDDPFDVRVRVVRADGSASREVFRNRVRSTYSRGWGPMPEGVPRGRIVWSPDGEWIAFGRAYDVGTSLWRLEIATGELRQVTRAER